MAKPRKDGLCSRCKNAQSNTYSNYCKLCTNKMQAAYKKANGYKHNKARELRIKDYIRKLKSEPCVDCNVAYPWYVMDFDHVRGEKKFNLSIAPEPSMGTFPLVCICFRNF